jgi:hypothetical protein
MTTIQIQPDTKVAVDDVLDGVARLNTPELEDFFHKVAQVLAVRKAPHLSKLESELLLKINAGYPDVVSKRFEQLLTKKEQQVLTTLEQQELVEITEQFEAFDAKKLEALLELAQLRDVSLDELLKHMTQPSASH